MNAALMGLALLLFVAWLVGWIVFKVAGALIHIVLIVALISLIASLFTRRTRV